MLEGFEWIKDQNNNVDNVRGIGLLGAIRSCRASGCAISTARELMMFLKALFGRKLFSKTTFDELRINNRMQITIYPIHYRAGYMRIPLGRLGTMFMFGDVNQMASPAVPTSMKLAKAMK